MFGSKGTALPAGALGLVLVLSGCNGSGNSPVETNDADDSIGSVVAQPRPTPTGDPAPDPEPVPTPTPPSSAAIGESCHSDDPDRICLSLRFVAYKNSAGTSIVSQAAALGVLTSMNGIWGKCDIAFEIGEYLVVNPADYGLNYTITSMNELETVRAKFKTQDMLLGVTAGPWQISANAWTNMPGAQNPGAVYDGSVASYGPIYAHEYGHYLGLGHVSDTSDVMNPVIYSSSIGLTTSQCEAARSTAMAYWVRMLR
ncbi:MAG: M10 family metallopeptidase domain-containing protein [Oligoflexia bacterium]|nr:M10 family metallopeptidase domain-containing protein [Oligoflexia bacterium]